MKKILCFFIVALLAALLVVPCFAVETTVDRGDPVYWFGGSTLVGYSVTITRSDVRTGSSNSFTLAEDYTFPTAYTSNVQGHVGDVCYFMKPSEEYMLYINGSSTNGAISSTPFTPVIVEDHYGSVQGTAVYSGTDGFVDSGFSTALSDLSIIVSAILSNQYILIAIGLAVAVPLVAWGISKIKSLVKGY